jgi:hypothetical protein
LTHHEGFKIVTNLPKLSFEGDFSNLDEGGASLSLKFPSPILLILTKNILLRVYFYPSQFLVLLLKHFYFKFRGGLIAQVIAATAAAEATATTRELKTLELIRTFGLLF